MAGRPPAMRRRRGPRRAATRARRGRPRSDRRCARARLDRREARRVPSTHSSTASTPTTRPRPATGRPPPRARPRGCTPRGARTRSSRGGASGTRNRVSSVVEVGRDADVGLEVVLRRAARTAPSPKLKKTVRSRAPMLVARGRPHAACIAISGTAGFGWRRPRKKSLTSGCSCESRCTARITVSGSSQLQTPPPQRTTRSPRPIPGTTPRMHRLVAPGAAPGRSRTAPQSTRLCSEGSWR